MGPSFAGLAVIGASLRRWIKMVKTLKLLLIILLISIINGLFGAWIIGKTISPTSLYIISFGLGWFSMLLFVYLHIKYT